jgi:hypothetical protein
MSMVEAFTKLIAKFEESDGWDATQIDHTIFMSRKIALGADYEILVKIKDKEWFLSAFELCENLEIIFIKKEKAVKISFSIQEKNLNV